MRIPWTLASAALATPGCVVGFSVAAALLLPGASAGSFGASAVDFFCDGQTGSDFDFNDAGPSGASVSLSFGPGGANLAETVASTFPATTSSSLIVLGATSQIQGVSGGSGFCSTGTGTNMVDQSFSSIDLTDPNDPGFVDALIQIAVDGSIGVVGAGTLAQMQLFLFDGASILASLNCDASGCAVVGFTDQLVITDVSAGGLTGIGVGGTLQFLLQVPRNGEFNVVLDMGTRAEMENVLAGNVAQSLFGETVTLDVSSTDPTVAIGANPVPEPSTLALLSLGLAVLAHRARARSRDG